MQNKLENVSKNVGKFKTFTDKNIMITIFVSSDNKIKKQVTVDEAAKNLQY